jgi:hypothetical protein
MMRFPVSLPVSLVAIAALALCAGTRAQVAPAQTTQPQGSGNGAYISVDPLANVRYDNRFDLSVGAAYDHMKAGPTLLQGSNIGGLDLEGSYWFSKHWAVVGSGRYYLGTSGAGTNDPPDNKGAIKGPFVSEAFFTGGAEWLGPHNKHGAILAHAMFGGVYGNFQTDLRGNPPYVVDFYSDQFAPAAIIGGHFDLNRSPRWVFRITPDAVMTHYYSISGPNAPKVTQFDVNFAISAGIEYKFKKKR